MEKELELLSPLIDELQLFCQGLKAGDAGAADRMITGLRRLWPEIPAIQLVDETLAGDKQPAPDTRRDFLAIVHDVGDVADGLRAERSPDDRLAWCRANLIRDLELFKNSSATIV